MLVISHLALDFLLSYQKIQGLPVGHKVTGLLQWLSVTFTHDSQQEALIEETQQEMGAKRSSVAHIVLLRLVLKMSATRPLHFPKLLMACHFSNWFADDFSAFCFQMTRIRGGIKFGVDMYGLEPATTRIKLVLQEFEHAEEADW